LRPRLSKSYTLEAHGTRKFEVATAAEEGPEVQESPVPVVEEEEVKEAEGSKSNGKATSKSGPSNDANKKKKKSKKAKGCTTM